MKVHTHTHIPHILHTSVIIALVITTNVCVIEFRNRFVMASYISKNLESSVSRIVMKVLVVRSGLEEQRKRNATLCRLEGKCFKVFCFFLLICHFTT